MRKILIAVIIAFILFSCDTEPMSENIEFEKYLIGTWEGKFTYNGIDVRQIFTETNFKRYAKLDGEWVLYIDTEYSNENLDDGRKKYSWTVLINGNPAILTDYYIFENNGDKLIQSGSSDYGEFYRYK